MSQQRAQRTPHREGTAQTQVSATGTGRKKKKNLSPFDGCEGTICRVLFWCLLSFRFIKTAKKSSFLTELIERKQRWQQVLGGQQPDHEDDDDDDDKR
jgi:hypothetical protein